MTLAARRRGSGPSAPAVELPGGSAGLVGAGGHPWILRFAIYSIALFVYPVAMNGFAALMIARTHYLLACRAGRRPPARLLAGA